MRPWLLMRVLDIEFVEDLVLLDGFKRSSRFEQTMVSLHPAATVVALSHNDVVVADGRNIAEYIAGYIAEPFPTARVRPQDHAENALPER